MSSYYVKKKNSKYVVKYKGNKLIKVVQDGSGVNTPCPYPRTCI
jgi:hypothetical protein